MFKYFFFMLSALPFLACKITERKPVAVPAGFDWQGHRGCRGIMPENSLAAFMKALDFPQVSTLELDLAVSKDHQLVVSHEPFFNPSICIKPNGEPILKEEAEKTSLYQLTLPEIQAYDCGSIGNPRFPHQAKQRSYKPSFKEVVQAAQKKRPGIRWNIEIKSQPKWDGLYHPPVSEFARMVIQEIQALGIEKQCTVQSFDVRALEAMHQQAPEIPLAYLIESNDSFKVNMGKLSFTPAIYSPYYLKVSSDLVKDCRRLQMKLVPWTVNEVHSMRRLIRLGVNGIITDHPDLINLVGK
jgi:glycerophosphoryl diester phosphodiesterase